MSKHLKEKLCKQQQDALGNSAVDAVTATWVFPQELLTL